MSGECPLARESFVRLLPGQSVDMRVFKSSQFTNILQSSEVNFTTTKKGPSKRLRLEIDVEWGPTVRVN